MHSEQADKFLNIVMFTNSYPPNLNGVAICVKNLEEELISRGHKVFIVTPKVPKVKYADNVYAIPSTAMPKVISKDLRVSMSYQSSAILKFLRLNKVDIIHSHDTYTSGLDALWVADKLQIPIVHTYHTLIETMDILEFLVIPLLLELFLRWFVIIVIL
jgi:1,2-diacylglycerol 3-alpha-glucosyltransferase